MLVGRLSERFNVALFLIIRDVELSCVFGCVGLIGVDSATGTNGVLMLVSAFKVFLL